MEKRFFKYLCARKFTLITDYQPLLKTFGNKSQLPPLVATRVNHWSLYLSQFNNDAQYRKLADHGNAVALSRLTINSPTSNFQMDLKTQIFRNI